MRRQYHMPFGAEVRDGRVRFRLWAPAAKQVELLLQGLAPEAGLKMAVEDNGWFGLSTEMAADGTCYQFCIDGHLRVPDPASRFQAEDIHGSSRVIDPGTWDWQDVEWQGRPWEEAMIYELHVGSFTPKGTFAGVKERLGYLVDLGVTAIELMPVADFPGTRSWGYDGVLSFAPDSQYGHPNELKDLIQSAHNKGLMVFLDVVYNHFGPEGNYLHTYAPQFFSERHRTPWGAAINFDGPDSRTVRDFFIHNALYWLTEYHLDGLRLDAVHAILDDSDPDILLELAEAVRQGPGQERHVHLVLENDHNAAHYLEHGYRAQWNDDIHHALHVLLTGEADSYYRDYAEKPLWHLGRCLTEGFAYQGEPSPYRGGVPRGEPSRDLAPTAFVSFLQNHDQVGNRASGERLAGLVEPRALRAAVTIILLAPSPPLLFMGEEWGATEPFLFFCDFGPDLAAAVTEGRRNEFARFEKFADPTIHAALPDPNAAETFERTRLDWSCVAHPPHETWLQFYRDLLTLRRRAIIPRLQGMQGGQARFRLLGERGLAAEWRLGEGSVLSLVANLGPEAIPGVVQPQGEILYATEDQLTVALERQVLPPWSVIWFLDTARRERSG